ncbi:MAG: serine/threonine protein kinase, partial [bacterium]
TRADKEFEQSVAIKILPASLSTQSSHQRFERERQVLAGLRHPGIAALLDGGTTDNGLLWFAMEYIDGLSLIQYCNDNHLSIEARLVLFTEICTALIYAHKNGVIHRDIKPANILIEETSDGRRVALLDFGIASVDSTPSELTLTGLIIGTPGYMSPEQVRGEVDSIDRRSDIFALGIVLYELISRQHPFLSESAAETSYAILHNEPELTNIKDAPKDLQAIALHCLEKNPGDRYSSVRSVGRDIQAYLNGESISVRPQSVWCRWLNAIRKRPWVSAIVVTAFLATLFSIIAATLWSYQQTELAQKELSLVENVTSQAQQIRDKLRLIYMQPTHNIDQDLAQLTDHFIELSQLAIESSERSQPTLNASLGHTSGLLGKHQKAILYLQNAWQAGNKSETVFINLIDNYTYLYFNAINQAQLINDPETKQTAILNSRAKYLEPALKIISQNNRKQSPILKAHASLLKRDFSHSISYALQSNETADWPWPAWKIIAQAHFEQAQLFIQEGKFENAKKAYGQASRILNTAQNFSRSLPDIAQMQCQLDTNLISVTDLQTINPESYIAPGCERLLKISPSSESHRAQAALAYTAAAIRLLRFAKKAEQPLDRINQLLGENALGTVDGQYARGMMNSILGEQILLSEGDSSHYFLQAAESFEAALKINPDRWDIRGELAWALSLAGRSSYSIGKDGSEYYKRSNAVWNDLINLTDPPLIALLSAGDNLTEWAYDSWQLGQSKSEDIRQILKLLYNKMQSSPATKGIYYTAASLLNILALEQYWKNENPDALIRQELKIFQQYNQLGFSYSTQHAQFSALFLNNLYQHDHQQISTDFTALKTLGEKMLSQKDSLEAVDMTQGMLAMIEAEEHIINKKSPVQLLKKAKRDFLNASKLDIDRKDALENLARVLWQEYKWRIPNASVNCKNFQKDIAPIKHSLEQHSALPFVRYYYIRLLSTLQKQSRCGVDSDTIHHQINLLNAAHALVANKLKQEIY